MRRHRGRDFWTCLTALSLLPAMAQSAPDKKQLRTIFPYEASQPGCAVGVYQNGAPVYMEGFGAADIGSRTPLGPDTVFNIASVSKQFTAFAIFLLAKRGALALSDPVTKYVPELGAYARDVTLEDLLHHTGGLPDYLGVVMIKGLRITEPAQRRDGLEALRVLKTPLFAPGTQWAYSNTGYFLLAVVAERVTGESLKAFEQKNIFEPLGMRDTGVVDAYPTDIAHLAHGYVPAGNGFSVLESPWEMTGDGQVHTTIRDLQRWDENFYTGAVGGKDVIAEMLRPGRLRNGERVDYGGGVFLGDVGGLPTVQHSGSWAGYRTSILRFPAQHFSVAVLCNRADADPVTPAQKVSELYLQSQLQAVPRREVRALAQSGAAEDPAQMPLGFYKNPQTGLFFGLEHRDGKTVLRNWGTTWPLQEVAPHVYTEGVGGYYAFDFGGPGKPPRILASFGAAQVDCVYTESWQPPSLEAYKGTYANPETGLHFAVGGTDTLLTLDRGIDVSPLTPVAAREFETQGGMSVIRFLPGKSGGFEYREYGLKLLFAHEP